MTTELDMIKMAKTIDYAVIPAFIGWYLRRSRHFDHFTSKLFTMSYDYT